MSDEARTVLVVSDDPCFSGQVSEFMLQVGIGTIRFTRTREALERARDLAPDLVLVHIPRGRLDPAWACYELLQSDSRIASIPVLLYAPPRALAQRAVGPPNRRPSVDQPAVSDMLIAQINSLIETGPSISDRAYAEPAEQRFPIGRDDL
jgi:CheY-like chemotaxis protein